MKVNGSGWFGWVAVAVRLIVATVVEDGVGFGFGGEEVGGSGLGVVRPWWLGHGGLGGGVVWSGGFGFL